MKNYSFSLQLVALELWQIVCACFISSSWLYPRIVWGGIWGLLFILPMLDSKLLRKGSVLSLFPTAVQLFVIFPFKAGKGMAGLELGALLLQSQ